MNLQKVWLTLGTLSLSLGGCVLAPGETENFDIRKDAVAGAEAADDENGEAVEGAQVGDGEGAGLEVNDAVVGPRASNWFYGYDAVYQNGDFNGDGSVTLSDGVAIFDYLFKGADLPANGCLRAGDVDGSGHLNLTDGFNVLNYLFHGGIAPVAPFGDDGTAWGNRGSNGQSSVAATGCSKLDRYRTMEEPILAPRDAQFSGITTLYWPGPGPVLRGYIVVGDNKAGGGGEHNPVHFFSSDFQLIDTLTLSQSYDLEGAAYLGGNLVAVIDEKTGRIIVIEVGEDHGELMVVQTIDVTGVADGGNAGPEGLAYDQESRTFYIGRQNGTIYAVAHPTGSIVVSATEMFQVPNVSNLHGLEFNEGSLFALTENGGVGVNSIIELDLGGNVRGVVRIGSRSSAHDWEGVTFNADGDIVVVYDGGGDDPAEIGFIR